MHCAHRNVSVHEFFDSAMILTDSAVHEVDVARWLLDDEIARVTVLAPRTTRARAGLRDPQLLLLETAGGRLVDVEAFVSAGYGYDIRCEVVGEDGTLELSRPRGHAAPGIALAADFRERFATAYQHELQAWVDGTPGPSAWDGYAAAAVAEAAVQSLETGRRSTSAWPDARSAAPRAHARSRPRARTPRTAPAPTADAGATAPLAGPSGRTGAMWAALPDAARPRRSGRARRALRRRTY